MQTSVRVDPTLNALGSLLHPGAGLSASQAHLPRCPVPRCSGCPTGGGERAAQAVQVDDRDRAAVVLEVEVRVGDVEGGGALPGETTTPVGTPVEPLVRRRQPVVRVEAPAGGYREARGEEPARTRRTWTKAWRERRAGRGPGARSLVREGGTGNRHRANGGPRSKVRACVPPRATRPRLGAGQP